MDDIARKVSVMRLIMEDCDFRRPSKDGTGSPTSIAQFSFMDGHFRKLAQEHKNSWRDNVRTKVSELFATKSQPELQRHLIEVMALCAEWYDDIEGRG